MMNKIFLVGVACAPLMLSGCALWPYKSDFDCPIPKGIHCKSLYEVNKMVDKGEFDPEQGTLTGDEGQICGRGLPC